MAQCWGFVPAVSAGSSGWTHAGHVSTLSEKFINSEPNMRLPAMVRKPLLFLCGVCETTVITILQALMGGLIWTLLPFFAWMFVLIVITGPREPHYSPLHPLSKGFQKCAPCNDERGLWKRSTNRMESRFSAVSGWHINLCLIRRNYVFIFIILNK